MLPIIAISFFMMMAAYTSSPKTPAATSPALITEMAELQGAWEPFPLAKTWREYRPDGTFCVARTRDALEDAPALTGEYWFQGDILHFNEISVKPSWACGGKLIGQYEVQVLENGEITFVMVEDSCSERAAVLSNGSYRKD
jgi:hypothetical protein